MNYQKIIFDLKEYLAFYLFRQQIIKIRETIFNHQF